MLVLSKVKSLRVIPFLFVFTFLISIVVAQEVVTLDSHDVTAQYFRNFDLKRTCSNNGTYCSSSTVCNITLVRPDGSLIINNRGATNNLAYYNVSLNTSDLNFLGKGFGTMTCSDNAGNIKGNGYTTFDFEVTGDGNKKDNIPLQIIMMCLGFAFILIGKLREDFNIVQTIGSIVCIVMGVLTLYPGYAYLNYSVLGGLLLGTISIGLGFYFMLERNVSRGKAPERYEQPEEDGRYHG